MALFGAHNIQVLSHAKTSTPTSVIAPTTMVASNYSDNATNDDFFDVNSININVDRDYDNIIATAPIDGQFVSFLRQTRLISFCFSTSSINIVR